MSSPLAGADNNDAFCACGDMGAGFLGVGEQAGGLDDEVYPQFFPGQFSGVPFFQDLDWSRQ